MSAVKQLQQAFAGGDFHSVALRHAERLDAANVKWTALDNELRERDKQLIAANTENERLRAELDSTMRLLDAEQRHSESMRNKVSAAEAELATARNDALVSARGNGKQILFYEREFYVLSNFSAFKLNWHGIVFDTAEHAYHWTRFPVNSPEQHIIRESASAHDAFRFAQENKRQQVSNWDAVKVGVMRNILRAKSEQHEYVRRKLLETGERELIEDSWRDDFWGWGPSRDGNNMLGKLWTEIRTALKREGDGNG